MGENAASKNCHNNHHLHNHHQVFDISIDVLPQNGSKCFDDDGRLKRTGTLPHPSPVSAPFLPCLCFVSGRKFSYNLEV